MASCIPDQWKPGQYQRVTVAGPDFALVSNDRRRHCGWLLPGSTGAAPPPVRLSPFIAIPGECLPVSGVDGPGKQTAEVSSMHILTFRRCAERASSPGDRIAGGFDEDRYGASAVSIMVIIPGPLCPACAR